MAGLNEGSNQGDQSAEAMMRQLERQAANHFETVDDMEVNTVRATVGDAVTNTIQDDWQSPVAELAPANNPDMSGATDKQLDSRLVA